MFAGDSTVRSAPICRVSLTCGKPRALVRPALTLASTRRYGPVTMKKKLSLQPVKKLALSRVTLARLEGKQVSRLDLVAVQAGARNSWAPGEGEPTP
jgi:hypothetical protein